MKNLRVLETRSALLKGWKNKFQSLFVDWRKRVLFGICISCVNMTAPDIAHATRSAVATNNSTNSKSCIAAAAKYHKVNHSVLSAILKVESSYNAGAVNHNADGSVDVGIGQMNSIHFKELSIHGITPTNLLDPCVGSYVAAWHLGRQIQLHGNTWFAIGAYHSVTPSHNARYQALIYNAMVDMRMVPGPKLVVTPLKAESKPQTVAVTP